MPNSLNYLPWAKPFVDKSANMQNRPYAEKLANQTREVALTTPIFLRGCSQFYVEFAGDFFEQSIGEPLGTIDYDLLPGGAGAGSRIHWYWRGS